MGTIRKIGQEYYIEFMARGLKYQQKAGLDEAAAQRLLTEVEAKIHSGEMSIPNREVDWKIFAVDFMDFIKREHPGATTWRFQTLVNDYDAFLVRRVSATAKLVQMTPRVIEDYKTYLQREARHHNRPLKSRLINFTLLLLSEIFEYAVKLGYLNDNPVLHIRWVRSNGGRVLQPLSAAQQQALLNSAGPALRILFEFMLLAGLSAGQAGRLSWQNVVEKDGQPALSLAGTVVALQPRAREILQQQKQESARHLDFVFCDTGQRPFTAAAIIRQFALIDKSGSADLACLRQTFVYDLLQRKIPILRLYRSWGKTDIACLVRYLPLVQEINEQKTV